MPTAYAGEGGITTSRPDTADHSTYHHQTPTQDSRDHAITVQHATYNTAFFSRISAYKETMDQVAEVHGKKPTEYFLVKMQDEYPIQEK